MAKTPKYKLRNIVAANIRRERLALKQVQEEIAHRSGLSQTYISQVESAQRAVSIDAIERIAAALNLPADRLLRL